MQVAEIFFLGGTQKTYVDEWLLSVSLRLCGWAGPVPAALLIQGGIFCNLIKIFLQLLWSRDAKPIYGATMSCRRFTYLLSHLRLDNKATRDVDKLRDKFAPAREVFELFNNACSKAMQCGPDLCIDETLFANRYFFAELKEFVQVDTQFVFFFIPR